MITHPCVLSELDRKINCCAKSPSIPLCMDREHSLHLFGDMVDTKVIIGMTYLCGVWACRGKRCP